MKSGHRKEVELAAATLEEIYAELTRRRTLEAPTQYQWVCRDCGNVFVGGTLMDTAYVLGGRVWCKVCHPTFKPNLFSFNGEPVSRPMERQRIPYDEDF